MINKKETDMKDVMDSIKEEIMKENNLKLMGLVTELDREMRILENKIEEIKTIIYHL